jgi:hypothetical protein
VTDSLSDPNGATAERLRTLVADYGPRVLDDRAALARVLPDVFADLPRERRIVEAAAGAGVAGRLTTQVTQGTPLPTAMGNVSHLLAEQYSLTANAAEWVVRTYAGALGLLAPAAPQLPASGPPGATVLDNAWQQQPPPQQQWPPQATWSPPPQGGPPTGWEQAAFPQVSGPPQHLAYPQQWSAPPAAPRPRRTWLIVLGIALPVLALVAGVGTFAAVKLLRPPADCVIGTWDLTSETVTYTNPASTVTYDGSGTMRISFNTDGTGTMVTDHVEFSMGASGTYSQTGTVSYRWTRNGDQITYSGAQGKVTTVVKTPGQADRSTTADGGPLTSDTITCAGDDLTTTGGGESSNDDGSKGTYTYNQKFHRA